MARRIICYEPARKRIGEKMENHNSSKKRLKTENPNSKIKEAKFKKNIIIIWGVQTK